MFEEFKVLCPWCSKGKVYTEPNGSGTLTVQCPKCRHCFRIRLDDCSTVKVQAFHPLPIVFVRPYVRVSDAMYGSAALIASRKMQLELADQPQCSAYQDYEAPSVQTTITSCYGLDDLGLTATQEDLSAISEGRLPPQLLTDNVHYTTQVRQLIGDLIFRRCRELNIF